ncbi:MAG: hypothetical protein H6873_10455 [Hyphomicrobiaceae bacterium]|nr:hypothetical protein [Hyphomicrobiaceae bacterium]
MGTQGNIIATAASFVVRDLKRSVEWYRDRLDFDVPELDWESHPRMCVIERDGALLLLNEGKPTGPTNRHALPGSNICDAYFWVRDVKKLQLAIKVGGTPLFAGPVTRRYGATELMVLDPDDHLLCFAQYSTQT